MNEQESKTHKPIPFDLGSEPTHEITRIFNKRLAPAGSIFLVVTIKIGKRGFCKQAQLVSYDFSRDAEAVKELVEKMIISLKAKYKL